MSSLTEQAKRFSRFAVLLCFGISLFLFLNANTPVYGQIGGKTAADGPFTLDDAEDLDLVADSVGRNWISDYVYPHGDVLSALPLAGSGLTPAPGQSSVGALKATIPSSYGYISGGFGVPMPAVVGASTATDPGDITSFNYLTFYACSEPVISEQVFQVILETYPETSPGVYPTISWNFSSASESTFERVTIDLRRPVLIENAGSLTLEELLSQTRFLYFYSFASVLIPATLELHVDDIRLEEWLEAAARNWQLYE